jgi:hypothetical protein
MVNFQTRGQNRRLSIHKQSIKSRSVIRRLPGGDGEITANKNYLIVAMVAEAGREMVDNAVRAGREALQDEWSTDL